MGNRRTETRKCPNAGCRDALTEMLRDGTQRLLAQAVPLEAEAWIAACVEPVGSQDHRQVVCNGYLPEGKVMAGIGMIPVRQPRVAEEGGSPKRDAEQRGAPGLSGHGLQTLPERPARLPAAQRLGVTPGCYSWC